jgi:hypothetical protein
MKLGKALAWTGMGEKVAPTPWWKRPVEWVAGLVSRVKGSEAPAPQKLSAPKDVASNRWAQGAAAVGATAAGIFVLVRRRRQPSDEDTDASEGADGGTDTSQTPGNAAKPSESTSPVEEGSGG